MTTPTSSPPDLSDYTAVVTGAAGGIGQSVCASLAREGASIVATDIQSGGLDQVASTVGDRGQECLTKTCDVTDPEDVQSLKDETFDQYDTVEIVVNAHGVVLSRDPFEEESFKDWKQTININLTGTFLVTQAFYEEMIAEGYGKIVIIGSVAGQTGRSRPSTGYSSSKGGVHAFTKSLAKQGAEHGILVNGIAPGPVKTPLTDMGENIPATEQPLNRLGEPEDVAEAVTFFASQQSNWTTGAILDVNGGAFIG